MDDLDKDILGELQDSYSLTPRVTEIAKKLKKSSTTIHSRIKRLERKGVIRGYRANIDANKIGKDLNAFYFIKTDRGMEEYAGDSIAKELLKNPRVKNVYNTMGEWDLVVQFIGKDSDDYMEFMRSVEPLKGIKETKGKYILKVYASDFKLIPD
jgi:Lrp/AsnC family leucine-responsive transcriptional regulator